MYLFQEAVHARQLADLLALVGQCSIDAIAEVSDHLDVCRKSLHLVLHFLEITFHLPNEKR